MEGFVRFAQRLERKRRKVFLCVKRKEEKLASSFEAYLALAIDPDDDLKRLKLDPTAIIKAKSPIFNNSDLLFNAFDFV